MGSRNLSKTAEKSSSSPPAAVFGRVASRFGISVWYRLVFSWYFPNGYRRKTRLLRFGIVHLAGNPFSLTSAPFLMDQAPLLRGVLAKFHKMELPPNLTVQKITYIPYPIPTGNLITDTGQTASKQMRCNSSVWAGKTLSSNSTYSLPPLLQ